MFECCELFEWFKNELFVYVVVEDCYFYILLMMIDLGFNIICYVLVEYYKMDELLE